MQRSIRLTVVASVALAAGVYLATIGVRYPRDAVVGLALALLGAAGGRIGPVWTGRVLLATTFVAPGLFNLALGTELTHVLSLWLIPVATWLLASASWRTWSLPGRWRGVLMAWALVVGVCWPIVALRELDFTLALFDDVTLTNGLAGGPPSLWVHTAVTVALSQLVGFLWIDWLFERHGADASEDLVLRDVVGPLAIGAAVTCAAGMYQSWIDLDWLNYGVWVERKRASGMLFGANELGIVAATWGPAIAGLWWNRRGGGWVAAAALSLGWIGLWVSGSRTALFAGVIGTAFLAVAVMRDRRLRWKSLVPALGGAALLLAIAVASGGMRTATPLGRALATLPSPTHFAEVRAFARRMLWERDGWGRASIAAMERHPITGVGVGSFDRQSVDLYYRQTGGRLLPDNAQNWWRQQASELGIIGAALAIAWTALIVALLTRGRPKEEQRVPAASVCGALVGFGAASMFGVPAQIPPVAFAFWVLLFLAARLYAPGGESLRGWTRHERPVSAAIWVVTLATAAGQIHVARHELRPPFRAMQVGMQYGYGFWRGGTDANGEPFWWTGQDATFVFPLGHGTLELHATPMHPDIETAPVRVQIWLRSQKVIDRMARDRSPIVVQVPVRPGDRAVMIDTRVSRLFLGRGVRGRGLMIQKRVEAGGPGVVPIPPPPR